MGKIIEMRDKLRQLTPSRMEQEVLSIIQKNETVATNMNTDQLFGGEDAKGKSLPEYSDRSVQVFGKPAGPMRLFDSGDFYRGFFLDSSRFPVIIFSNDNKTGKIADLLDSKGRDPDDIYGLNKTNFKDFARSYVLEDLGKFLSNFLGLR